MSSDFKAPRFLDSVGRPRKVSQGGMLAIMRHYREGVSAREIATQYGISRSLVHTICYHVTRDTDKETVVQAKMEVLKQKYSR